MERHGVAVPRCPGSGNSSGASLQPNGYGGRVAVVCPICECAQFRVLLVTRPHRKELKGEYSIVECRKCGCVYLNPRLTDDLLSSAYALLEAGDGAERFAERLETKPVNALTRHWRRFCSYRVAEAVPQGPVIDLGCNRGELIEELLARGLEASGVESSPAAVSYCKMRGLQVQQARLEDFRIPRGQYRTVVLSHVLEHLQDPVGVLKDVAASLPDDGSVVICVPHVRSPMRWLFGAHWHGWDPPFHLVHYDSRSVSAVCDMAGLEVVKIAKRMIPDDLRRSLLLWRGKSGRQLVLRVLSVPVLCSLSCFGFGSYLLVTAKLAPRDR